MLHYKKIEYDCGCIVGKHDSTVNSCENHPNSIIKSVELSYIDIVNMLSPEISKTWGKVKNSEAIEGEEDIVHGIKFNLE